MGFLNNNTKAEKPVKTPETTFASARSNLLLVAGFTAVNVILRLVSADMYFLFSASTPMAFLDIAEVTEISSLMRVAAVLAFIVIGVYLLCWFMSKKQSAWMIVATVLFALDTLVLLGLYDLSSMIIDLLIHVWVLYYLITGSVAAVKMKKQPPMPVAAPEFQPVVPDYTAEGGYPAQSAEADIPVAETAPVMVNGEPLQEE